MLDAAMALIARSGSRAVTLAEVGVLSLLRSAVQPVMADAGRGLPTARQRPGLALVALADAGQAGGR